MGKGDEKAFVVVVVYVVVLVSIVVLESDRIASGVARKVSSLRIRAISGEEERIQKENGRRVRETHGDFHENWKRAIEREIDDRKGGGSAKHGVTKFFDLSEEEFREQYLGLLSTSTSSSASKDAFRKHQMEKLPQYYDWRARGAVTPVKDQGQCGSCWTFSTTGTIEGANFIKTCKLVSLSEQQLLDCDVGCAPDIPNACDSGCNGGLPSNAMEYIVEHGGLDTEKSYPYKAIKG